LKNDYKDLMSRIEKGLHEHHARLAEQAQNTPGATDQTQAGLSAPRAALEAPFAKVNSVVAGSPADEAGLKVGDSITKFGWVDWTNHERLGRVAEAVSQNEGVSGPSLLCWQHHSLARLAPAWHAVNDSVSTS
jgi:26S proteasome non-ATPase regulatory subunit 9